MKYMFTALLLFCLLLAACSKKEKKESEEQAPAPAAKEANRTDTAILHIEPSMLRDVPNHHDCG